MPAGGEGRRRVGRSRKAYMERETVKLKEKKITSEDSKNLEWKLVDIQYLVL